MSESTLQAAPIQESSEQAGVSPASESGLHLVTGQTMRRALLDARADLGPRSIVVDQRADLDPSTGLARVTLVVSASVPRSAEALTTLRRDAKALLQSGAKAVKSSPSGQARKRSPLADVERRLREHGASKKLRERILQGIVQADSSESHPLDLAAVEVGAAFEVASLPFQKGETTVLAVLGSNGVGKTTTLAKLSARLVRAGRKVALATLDTDRVGASAQIASFGKSIGVPAIAVQDPVRFGASLAAPGAQRYDVVLLDGSGDVPSDVAAVQGIIESANAPHIRVVTLATLSASAAPAALTAVTAALEPLRPVGAIITKVDETAEPVPVLELAASQGLPIAFLTNGPDLGAHFHRAGPERFADVALIGRIG